MSKNAARISVENLSFEAALEELQTIIRELENGQILLEDSIAAYERGNELKKHCEKKLREAQLKIETITITQDGAVQTAPFGKQE